jgi:hypothetical protein
VIQYQIKQILRRFTSVEAVTFDIFITSSLPEENVALSTDYRELEYEYKPHCHGYYSAGSYSHHTSDNNNNGDDGTDYYPHKPEYDPSEYPSPYNNGHPPYDYGKPEYGPVGPACHPYQSSYDAGVLGGIAHGCVPSYYGSKAPGSFASKKPKHYNIFAYYQKGGNKDYKKSYDDDDEEDEYDVADGSNYYTGNKDRKYSRAGRPCHKKAKNYHRVKYVYERGRFIQRNYRPMRTAMA